MTNNDFSSLIATALGGRQYRVAVNKKFVVDAAILSPEGWRHFLFGEVEPSPAAASAIAKAMIRIADRSPHVGDAGTIMEGSDNLSGGVIVEATRNTVIFDYDSLIHSMAFPKGREFKRRRGQWFPTDNSKDELVIGYRHKLFDTVKDDE